MSIKSFLAKPFANSIARKINKWNSSAERNQEFIFHSLINKAKKTVFGKEHDFEKVNSYSDFIKAVPLREYEQFEKYILRIKNGEQNIVWNGKPIYFAKSSGTTSGIKYIPITSDSISNHIDTARNALLMYIKETGKANFVNGKMIFLSGSPELEKVGGILTGRLSGIVNHHIPKYLKGNQLPSYQTNCIDDWENKLERIVDETHKQDMTLISGIPPWVQMYFDKLLEKTGAENIKNVFPNLELLVYGGVNFEPYRSKLMNTIGNRIATIETYPASEGFIAFQDKQNIEGMLLNIDSGIFYEFVIASEIANPNPNRIQLQDVELNINYALVLNSNAGLWSYVIGDTIKFVSRNPYRIIVTGRTKHFISAFGEHVIAEEVESSMAEVANEFGIHIIEFTVAPQVNPGNKVLPYHEWLIEFGTVPDKLENFALRLNSILCKKNIYYNDLIVGGILQSLKIVVIPHAGFINYMKSCGKLGGQNKVPRLSNSRELADAILDSIKP